METARRDMNHLKVKEVLRRNIHTTTHLGKHNRADRLSKERGNLKSKHNTRCITLFCEESMKTGSPDFIRVAYSIALSNQSEILQFCEISV